MVADWVEHAAHQGCNVGSAGLNYYLEHYCVGTVSKSLTHSAQYHQLILGN